MGRTPPQGRPRDTLISDVQEFCCFKPSIQRVVLCGSKCGANSLNSRAFLREQESCPDRRNPGRPLIEPRSRATGS